MKRLLPAAIAALCLTSPAWGALTVYSHVGAWDVFSGTGTDGRAVCGIGNSNTTNGRAFSLRYIRGADGITFAADKPSWNIPEGTHLQVVMQVGLNPPWTQDAVGHGQRVEWTMEPRNVQVFDTQFRRAGSMTVTFPSGNEPPWVLSLSGSTAASNAMGRCVTAMMRSSTTAAPGQSAPQGPTQPFASTPEAPSQEGTPSQPTQPNSPPPLPPTH
ncbi:MAG TPA: hypothetical protein VFN42_08840 [Acetobacteraceae bacterium]|nr:hypothetical protein [Acetobacteraceae bacterium]